MGAGKAIKSGTHKNKTAWVAHKHQDGLKITDEMVQEIGWLDHCCEKCCDVLAWRRKYAKYKPLSQAGKCNRCQAKEVRRPYHSLCQPCASQTSQCAKCQQPYAIPQEVLDREAKMKYIKSKLGLLPERYRRSAERKLEKEEQDMDEIVSLVDRALRKREEEREGRKVTKVAGEGPAAAAADGYAFPPPLPSSFFFCLFYHARTHAPPPRTQRDGCH